jgi:hypothetical protein
MDARRSVVEGDPAIRLFAQYLDYARHKSPDIGEHLRTLRRYATGLAPHRARNPLVYREVLQELHAAQRAFVAYLQYARD